MIQCEIDWGSGLEIVPPPANIKALRLELIFTNDNPSATVQSINFEWVDTNNSKNATKLNEVRTNGMNGGTGIGEGVPLRMTICGSRPMVIFEGCIDLANSATHWECDKVIAPIKHTGGINWFNDNAEGITFALLDDLGIISPGHGEIGWQSTAKYFYKKTPYIVSFIPNAPLTITLGLEGFVLIEGCIKEANDIAKCIKSMIGGAAVVATAVGVVTTPSLIADIVNLLTEIAYASLLLIDSYSLVKQLLNEIYQTKKYKYCMRAEDLINAGFEYINSLGGPNKISFDSSILADNSSPYYNTTIMPPKRLMPARNQPLSGLLNFDRDRDDTKSALSYGYPDYDLKQLMDKLSKVFNAKGAIRYGIYSFEEIHSYNQQIGFTLPNVDSPGYNYNYPKPDSLNWNELSWNYSLKFQTDNSDGNTQHKYRGTTCSVNLSPIVVKNQLNLCPPPSVDINLEFALAKQKEYLNFAEQVVNKFLGGINAAANGIISVINAVISILNKLIRTFHLGGKISSLKYLPTSPLSARMQWLELSDDTFNDEKIFIGEDIGGDWVIKKDSYKDSQGNITNDMSAVALMERFHGLNLATRGNQQEIYKDKKFPLCCADFMIIFNYNIFHTADGKLGKFDKVVYDPWNSIVEAADYRIYNQYTNNLKETITVDGNTY